MKIAVGTENKVKLDAVKRGFEKAGFTDFTVVGVNVPSGISEQPFGETETLLGAKNRAQRTLDSYSDADIVIGIESGIMEDNCDLAIIYCLTEPEGYKIEHKKLSDKVQFPSESVEEARKRGFETVTVGQVMEEQGVVNNNKDPHLTLTGISRTVYLTEAITDLARDVKLAMSVTEKVLEARGLSRESIQDLKTSEVTEDRDIKPSN